MKRYASLRTEQVSVLEVGNVEQVKAAERAPAERMARRQRHVLRRNDHSLSHFVRDEPGSVTNNRARLS